MKEFHRTRTEENFGKLQPAKCFENTFLKEVRDLAAASPNPCSYRIRIMMLTGQRVVSSNDHNTFQIIKKKITRKTKNTTNNLTRKRSCLKMTRKQTKNQNDTENKIHTHTDRKWKERITPKVLLFHSIPEVFHILQSAISKKSRAPPNTSLKEFHRTRTEENFGKLPRCAFTFT